RSRRRGRRRAGRVPPPAGPPSFSCRQDALHSICSGTTRTVGAASKRKWRVWRPKGGPREAWRSLARGPGPAAPGRGAGHGVVGGVVPRVRALRRLEPLPAPAARAHRARDRRLVRVLAAEPAPAGAVGAVAPGWRVRAAGDGGGDRPHVER